MLDRVITGMTKVTVTSEGCEPYTCSLLMFCRANEGFYISDVAHALRKGDGKTQYGNGASPLFTVALRGVK